MPTLSNRLLSGLTDDTTLDHRLARCYGWIWYLIFHRQSADSLQQQLREIEETAPNTTPQFQLELAWKAQVIESLLNQTP